VAFIDVGAQTTDVSIYKDGNLCYTNMIPLGGDNITNDIAICLKIPFVEAEKLKIKYGDLERTTNENDIIIKVNAGYDKLKDVYLSYLNEIIEARTEEILYYVKQILKESNFDNEISGIVIVGGGLALFKGITGFASKVLDKSLRIGTPKYTGTSSPVYATVVGTINDIISTLKINKNVHVPKGKSNANVNNLKIKENIKERKEGFLSKIKDFFTDFF